MSVDDEVAQLRSRVIQLEAQVQFLYKHLGISYTPDTSYENQKQAEIIEQIRKGNMIEAIKIHRQIYNSGLAEAKSAVEALRAKLGYR